MILMKMLNMIRSGNIKIIDMSHKVCSHSPTWSGGCGFKMKPLLNYGEDLFCVQESTMVNQIGTHIDSPAHLFKGALDISQLRLSSLIAPICVVDIRDKVNENPTYKMSMTDVDNYTNQHGAIPQGAFLLARTGWEHRWNNVEKYRNADKNGVMRFPSISKEVAQYYSSSIAGLGIDTFSPDGGDIQTGFPVHEIMLGNRKIIIENITGLDQVPAYGAIAFCLPLNVESWTESPVRLIGMFEDSV